MTKSPERAEAEMAKIAATIDDFGPAPEREQAITSAKDALEMSLKDSESARYKFGEIVRGYVRRGGVFNERREMGWILLVEVNSKNSFGAYTGFERHYIFIKPGEAIDVTSLVDSKRAGVI